MNRIFNRHFLLGFAVLLSACSGKHSAKETDKPEGEKTKTISKNTTIEPKLYLEHSGSMYFYDGVNTQGEFKNTLVQLMQSFEEIKPKTSSVYIVNDSVYQYPQSLNELITSKNIFANKIGNPAYTDFQIIFDTMLKDLQEDQLSILFSDLIYSGKNSQGKIPSRIMDEAEQLCRGSFTQYSPNTSVLILKMNSDYKGVYYPYNSPNKGKPYSGNRPYYICLLAKNNTMEKFLKEDKYSEIRNFEKLPFFQKKFFFSNGTLLSAPYYTILESDPDARGKFNNGDRDLNTAGIHAIKDVESPHNKSEKMRICVAVKFPKGVIEESEIMNVNNYQIDGYKDGFKLIAVKPVDRKIDGATHKLILEANKAGGGEREVLIKFKRNFPPQWVQDSHTGDDTNLNADDTAFTNTTFGFKNMMNGINSAFSKPNSADNNYYFTLKLNLQD
jgi:hypothetical protein